MGLHCNGSGSLLHHYEVLEGGGKAAETAGESCRKRPHRRPGYMREDLPRPRSTRSGDEEEEEEEEEEEDESEGRTARTRNRGSVCPVRTGQNSIIDSPNTPCRSPVLSPNEGLLNLGRQPETGSCTELSWLVPSSPLSPPHPPEPVERRIAVGGAVNQSGTPGLALTRHLPEFPSSLSVDSDTASSVTSGYESATPASEQGWDHLVKKYEGILQDCLQNNRANTKIESMMLKLQRLQQKAILDDDYDTAERFGKKLAELCLERGALKLGLPSRQPSVASFLQRLTQAVNSTLQRTEHCQRRKEVRWGHGGLMECSPPDHWSRAASGLLPTSAEITELQHRLAGLQERRGRLEEQLHHHHQAEEEEEEEQEERNAEREELEISVLRGCSATQLWDMSRALRDLVTSDCRAHISVTPPPAVLRQEK
ncbi:hypothetical protein CRUP_020930 [Coryphaenoides rupestris]|nr:hypothetical protein CRUP_020930 [Coryphaenoides rupestris]